MVPVDCCQTDDVQFPAGQVQSGGGTNHKKLRRENRAKKSASVMWINGQIIASSQKGIDELLSTVWTHLPNMNLVNQTTAIHRLAKFASQAPKVRYHLEKSYVFGDLLQGIKWTLSNSISCDVQPQSLSNILWALASLRLADIELMTIACECALPSLERFKAFELSTVLWAVTKISTIDGRMQLNVDPVSTLLKSAATIVIEQMETMEFRCLSMVGWAYATAKLPKHELFKAMAARMTALVDTANCQEMGNTVWAFGTFGLNEQELFSVLARKGISEMQHLKAQELANMLWGFASCGFFHEAFYQKGANAAKTKDLSAQHVANILWAFSRVRPKHSLTHRTISSFLPFCWQHIDSFKAQELSSVALSVAKAHASTDQDASLPEEVIHFFACIAKAVPDAKDFSTQSLINMVSAFVMLGVRADRGALETFGQEILRRCGSLDASEVQRVFQIFLTVAPSGRLADVATTLAHQLANHLDALKARDVRSLSRTCMDFLGFRKWRDLSRPEVRSLLLRVAQSMSDANPCNESNKQQSRLDFFWETEVSTKVPTDPANILSDCSDDIFEMYSPDAPDRLKEIRRSFFELTNDSFNVQPPQEPLQCARALPCLPGLQCEGVQKFAGCLETQSQSVPKESASHTSDIPSWADGRSNGHTSDSPSWASDHHGSTLDAPALSEFQARLVQQLLDPGLGVQKSGFGETMQQPVGESHFQDSKRPDTSTWRARNCMMTGNRCFEQPPYTKAFDDSFDLPPTPQMHSEHQKHQLLQHLHRQLSQRRQEQQWPQPEPEPRVYHNENGTSFQPFSRQPTDASLWQQVWEPPSMSDIECRSHQQPQRQQQGISTPEAVHRQQPQWHQQEQTTPEAVHRQQPQWHQQEQKDASNPQSRWQIPEQQNSQHALPGTHTFWVPVCMACPNGGYPETEFGAAHALPLQQISSDAQQQMQDAIEDQMHDYDTDDGF